MVQVSMRASRWSLGTGGVVALLGLVLLLLPIGGEPAIRVTGFFLLAAAIVEAIAGLKGGRPPVNRIQLMMSIVAAGTALLVLLRPSAYPLVFITVLCLGVRGVGAVAAGAILADGVRGWIIGRGVVDLALMTVLLVGAPLAAVISILSGASIAGQRWPTNGDMILVNFVAASIFVTGISLIGIGVSQHRQAPAPEEGTPG